jgi:hypothetical protein
LREQHHHARCMADGPRGHAARRLRNAGGWMWLALAVGLTGCHHKAGFVLPSAAKAPLELETVPPPAPPLMIATIPEPELEPLPPLPPARPAPRRPAPVKETPPPPPVQVASAAEPAAAIGALSSGGDSAGQSQQQAKDLIASILKRIAALPAKIADGKKGEVRQVKRFLDQAQQALTTGDADGAKNLATKAGLLMDDMEKK